MSFASVVSQLYALGHELEPPAPGIARRKFDLAHMRVLAEALGSPQLRFASILIAGTNGKGSTAATLASILSVAGYRTALYTSPHLNRVNERIRISKSRSIKANSALPDLEPSPLEEIPEADFTRIYALVDERSRALVSAGMLPFYPSFFEVLTAIAFVYFAEQQVDIAVLEVGLGGRLDATNIVHPLLSIITDIALDHEEFLGSTIAEITREKAGILREDGTLITLPQHPEANQALGEIAASMNRLTARSAAEFIPSRLPKPSKQEGQSFLLPNVYDVFVQGRSLHVDSPLPGVHQQRNIALAIAGIVELRNKNGYEITDTAIEEGIRQTSWPGRLELVPPNLLLDVSHNPAGAWTLRSAIARFPEELPRTLIFSCLRDKNLPEMSQILFPLFDSGDPDRSSDRIIVTPVDNPRSSPVTMLLEAAAALGITAHGASDPAAALSEARLTLPPGGILVATGSVYLVGEIRKLALA